MGRRLRALWEEWTGRHCVALDVSILTFLIVTLGVLARGYLNDPPWGWAAAGFLSGAILIRTWALAWSLGYTRAARQCEDLIARQNATLAAQAQALDNTIRLPAVIVDDKTGRITIRGSISLN